MIGLPVKHPVIPLPAAAVPLAVEELAPFVVEFAPGVLWFDGLWVEGFCVELGEFGAGAL